MSDGAEILVLAERVKEACEKYKWTIATAESCTGGLLAASLTALPGSSDLFERGFVTYSNESKTELVGVPAKLIAEKGAVSAEVALAMARGVFEHSKSQVSIAITGIAGPTGGTEKKPVGRVHIAVGLRKKSQFTQRQYDFGDIGRNPVRQKAVEEALRFLLALLQPQTAA